MESKKYSCECGSNINDTKSSIDTHNATDKHKKFMENKLKAAEDERLKAVEAEKLKTVEKSTNSSNVKEDKATKTNNEHVANIKSLHNSYVYLKKETVHEYARSVLATSVKQKLRFVKFDMLSESEISNIKAICADCGVEFNATAE